MGAPYIYDISRLRVNIIVLTVLEIYFKFHIYFLSNSVHSAVISSLVNFLRSSECLSVPPKRL